MGYPRGKKNPIYAYKHFADYRNKVMQKELEKEKPIWPLWLEDAFLDALLLIPQMGRRKFSSKTILYGRNMLITEYLWIYYWLLNPPKNGEHIPDRKQREKGPDAKGEMKAHPMFRGRKQVSSHIQVLKGFFATLVVFHFIFPSKKDSKDDDGKLMKDDEDTKAFKDNRVLISIADARLPDERPNYEYFARLLNADNDVFLRPKQCWIYISSSNVSLREKHITSEDGTTRKQITGYHPNGHWLGEAEYPHLKLNDSKDYKDLPRTGDPSTVLLHEYTKSFSQRESSSIKDISNKWEVRFPELKEKLMAAMDDTRPSDEQSSRCVVGPCDTFHFEVVLDLHSTSKFPDGTELNGLVQLSINRPELHNHSWRSISSVVKPKELYLSKQGPEPWKEPEFWTRSEAVTNDSRSGSGRSGRDTINVPFPVHSWANTFVKLAPYVNSDRERRERERATLEAAGLQGRAEREAARIKKEAEAKQKPGNKMPTPKELLSQVAMYQEIFSTPNDGSERSSKCSDWTRRAVILWTFVPVHEYMDDKKKSVVIPPGTSWRFLTKLDPTSQYHQQHAYLSGSPTVSRDSVMSPNPGYAHHVSAAMHENFSAAYDTGPGVLASSSSLPSQHHQQQHAHQQHHHHRQPHPLAGLTGLLDGFPNGLATPPPTASLQSSYAHSFDGSGGNSSSNNNNNNNNNTNIGNGDSLTHHLSFMSDGTSGTESQGTLVGDHHHHGSDAFLSDLDISGSASYDDASAPLQGWLAGRLGMDAAQWDGYTVEAQQQQQQQQQHNGVDVNDVVGNASWEHDTGALTSTSTSTAEPQWTSINMGMGSASAAAAAAAAAHDTRDSISLSGGSNWTAGEDDVASLHQHQHQQDIPEDHQDAWAAWQAAAAAVGVVAGGGVGGGGQNQGSWEDVNADVDLDVVDVDVDEGQTEQFDLGGTGLTPLRNHNNNNAHHHHSQNRDSSQQVAQSQNQNQGQSQGRKRSRSDSLDGGYPMHSVRKLTRNPHHVHLHHHQQHTQQQQHGHNNAPTAVMDDGGHGYL